VHLPTISPILLLTIWRSYLNVLLIRPTSAAIRPSVCLGGDIALEGIGAAAFDSLPEVFAHSRPASPRFFGYVFGSGEPVGVLGVFAASVLHQNATAWRSAPAAVAIERTVNQPALCWK